MEDNFRNVLIILSGIVIGAIFIHGLWTIRKQKNPYKLKASKDRVEPLTRSFDGKGFDQDGVSQVVIKKPLLQQEDEEPQNIEELSQPQNAEDKMFIAPNSSDAPANHSIKAVNDDLSGQLNSNLSETLSTDLDNDLSNDLNTELSAKLDDSQSENWLDNNTPKNFSKDELGDDLTPAITPKNSKENIREVVEPVYKQPVINAKPAISPSRQNIRPSIGKSLSKAELKRNQMEINFGDAKSKNDVMPNITMNEATDDTVGDSIGDSIKETNSTQERPAPQKLKTNTNKKSKLEPQVIILSVVMPANQQMLGAALLPSLLTLGLKYGEMNIFHRHQDNAGNGEVTFSLANMMKPGSFDLDTMETFATQGISLFMMLPNAGDSFSVFEQMLSAAKQLAQEFNGQLLDDKRNAMTQQTEQHYVSKIREFDRKSRIALVE